MDVNNTVKVVVDRGCDSPSGPPLSKIFDQPESSGESAARRGWPTKPTEPATGKFLKRSINYDPNPSDGSGTASIGCLGDLFRTI